MKQGSKAFATTKWYLNKEAASVLQTVSRGILSRPILCPLDRCCMYNFRLNDRVLNESRSFRDIRQLPEAAAPNLPLLREELQSRLDVLRRCHQYVNLRQGCSTYTVPEQLDIFGSPFTLSDVQKSLITQLLDIFEVDIEIAASAVMCSTRIRTLEDAVRSFYMERLYAQECCALVFRSDDEQILSVGVQILEQETLMEEYVDTIQKLATTLVPSTFSNNALLLDLWIQNAYQQQYQLMCLIFIVMYSHTPTSLSKVSRWLDALLTTRMFGEQASLRSPSLVGKLQILACLISIELIGVDLGAGSANSLVYFSSPDSVVSVHKQVMQIVDTLSIPQTAPITLLWSIMLHNLFVQRTIDLEGKWQSTWINSISSIPSPDDPRTSIHVDILTYLASASLELSPFAYLHANLNVLDDDSNVIGYRIVSQDYLFTVSRFVTFSEPLASLFAAVHKDQPILATRFWAAYEEDSPQYNLLQTAIGRFPYETTLFLQMLNSVTCPETSMVLFELITQLSSYTQVLPLDFKAYHHLSGTEIETNENLQLAGPGTNGQSELVLVTGTIGKIMTADQPLIVNWAYEWNGLHYLGHLLEDILNSKSFKQNASFACVIIKFITGLMESSNESVPLNCLQAVSEGMSEPLDIVTLSFDMLETTFRMKANSDFMKLSSSIIRFLSLALGHSPDTVWPVLSKLVKICKKEKMQPMTAGEVLCRDVDFTTEFAKLASQIQMTSTKASDTTALRIKSHVLFSSTTFLANCVLDFDTSNKIGGFCKCAMINHIRAKL